MEITTIPVPLDGVDHMVRIVLHKNPMCPFSGRKLKHPFKTRNVPVEIMRKGKPFTITNLAYDEDFCTEEVKVNVQEDSTRFFVKFDGSCGQFKSGVARRRHDLKIDPKTRTFKEIAHPELDYVECQMRPATPDGEIPAGFHWPHMRNVAFEVKGMKMMGDRWFVDAAKTFMATSWFEEHKDGENPIMGEWMGPKIQGNKSDPLDVNTFIPFNMIEFVVPVELRNRAGFQKLFAKIPNMEGLVAYCSGGMSIHKIRRDMFINEFGKNMGWGRKTPTEMEIPKELREVFETTGVRNFAEFLVKSVF